MTGPRWRLADLLLLVLACGIAFAGYRYFWQPPPDTNPRPNLSAHLILLATATLGSFFARPRWRRPCQGFAVFAWLNLAFVLWGGFGLTTYEDVERVVQGSQLGTVFGVLAALLATWVLEPPVVDPPPPAPADRVEGTSDGA
jgi:hypothetical protein